MSEQHQPTDNFDWEGWVAVNPEPRKRGSEILNRIHDSLPLSPREQAISEYAHKRLDEYREMEVPDELIARIQVDMMGSFLCAVDQEHGGELAEIAKLGDERPIRTDGQVGVDASGLDTELNGNGN